MCCMCFVIKFSRLTFGKNYSDLPCLCYIVVHVDFAVYCHNDVIITKIQYGLQ